MKKHKKYLTLFIFIISANSFSCNQYVLYDTDNRIIGDQIHGKLNTDYFVFSQSESKAIFIGKYFESYNNINIQFLSFNSDYYFGGGGNMYSSSGYNYYTSLN